MTKTKWVGDEMYRPGVDAAAAISQEDALAAMREMGVWCPSSQQINDLHYRLMAEWLAEHKDNYKDCFLK